MDPQSGTNNTDGKGAQEPLPFPRGVEPLGTHKAADGLPTFWFEQDKILDLLRHLKYKASPRYRMLFDLTCIDERHRSYDRASPEEGPARKFTAVYQLLSLEGNRFIRIKVPLSADYPTLPSVTSIWPSADWYEREAWDMFGVQFEGHPNLRRILMPNWWTGHPLRKEHPSRATEMGGYDLPDEKMAQQQESLRFKPEEWGAAPAPPGEEHMYLNLGPQHPGTHGPFRLVLQLDGERVLRAFPEIGFHHRAAEKMGERQSWHSYIPYTDRIDYLAGFLNELPYVLSVEMLAGISVPDRVKVMRVMLCELFRIVSHLVWYGTFAQDLGAMSPVFYMFNDREIALDIVSAITGARMHPGWFRIGGFPDDLPKGWQELFKNFLGYLPRRLDQYEKMVMRNPVFMDRTVGVGTYSLNEAIEWGATGPNLRACGLDWDLRKKQPYSGYEHFDFDIPTATHGDCYDRAVVRVAEMRQSLRIIEQCLKNMPEGSVKSDHPLATPPDKQRMLRDIETLIDHFLNTSWGPVIPPGEAAVPTEGAKGNNSYYLTSDGNTVSYRTRIRTPSFPHIQMLPLIARHASVADVLAILGSLDYVMGDVDR